jgi:hypothetical protein
MSPESEPLPATDQPATARFIAIATVVAVVAFVVSAAVAYRFWPSDYSASNDMSLYSLYGQRVADGQIPYRDFRLEYPPAALPLFALPLAGHKTLSAHTYYRNFAALATMLMAVTIAFTALSLWRLRRPRRNVLVALSLLAASAIALGSLVYTRYDVWPAALVAAALALLLNRRTAVAALALGVAIAAKLYPLVVLPLVVCFVWRRSGRRQALRALLLATAAAVAIVAPFVAIAPGAVEAAVRVQLEHSLQIESLGSAALVTLAKLGITFGDVALHSQTSTGLATTTSLAGSGTGTALAVLSVARVVVLLWIWVSFARGPATADRFLCSTAAALTASVALSPVLSPQFLIWLLPVVPLLQGGRGIVATAILAVGVALTHAWYPYRFFAFVDHLHTGDLALLLVRDLALVVLLLALITPRRLGSRAVARS